MPPHLRLAQAGELIGAGVLMEVRVDPILPGLTDDVSCLESLCAALAHIGVRRMATSVLFLRPAVTRAIRCLVRDKPALQRLLDAFSCARHLPIHAGSSRVLRFPNRLALTSSTA